MTTVVADSLEAAVRGAGFSFVPADQARAALVERVPLGAELDPAAFSAFASTWAAMPEDAYMADGGRYRRRRYAVLRAPHRGEGSPAPDFVVCPDEPHFQSLDYNRLNGGVARHFESVSPEALENAWFQAAMRLGFHTFEALFPPTPAVGAPSPAGHIEVHQFRIEAGRGLVGQPTPEGRHRDGVSFVLVMLVRRENVASGTTEVSLTDGSMLASFTLTRPLDMALVDDERVLHGVTAIEAIDPGKAAFRDVLVITYRWEHPDETTRFDAGRGK